MMMPFREVIGLELSIISSGDSAVSREVAVMAREICVGS